jgi:hypothetical protein
VIEGNEGSDSLIDRIERTYVLGLGLLRTGEGEEEKVELRLGALLGQH